MRFVLVAIFLIAFSSCPTRASAQKHRPVTWQGTVTHVSDGDTLWVQPDRGGEAVKIRIDAIDAPEICQAWGPESRAALAERVLHQQVAVQARAHDRFGRLVASISLGAGSPGGSGDVGQWQVHQGHAWANQFRRYRSRYGDSQAQARAARRGLWAAARPQLPSAFRKQRGSCAGHP